MKQLEILRKQKNAYGGELLKTRNGRSGPRPLATKNTMHLVLRSSKARGEWSFWKKKNDLKIRRLTEKFATKYGVKVFSIANVGNHLHFHIRLTNRFTYPSFIRALTGSIAMMVTGSSRWKPLSRTSASLEKDGALKLQPKKKLRFWDYRPFTRVVQSFRALLNLRDYIQINQLEGHGVRRDEARFLVGMNRAGLLDSS